MRLRAVVRSRMVCWSPTTCRTTAVSTAWMARPASASVATSGRLRGSAM
jgi:hypothetical protein